MHPEAPPIQVRECRTAFYAGALAMFNAINEAADDDTTEEQGAELIEALRLEIIATLDGMARSRPGKKSRPNFYKDH